MPGSPGCPEVPGGQAFGHYTTTKKLEHKKWKIH